MLWLLSLSTTPNRELRVKYLLFVLGLWKEKCLSNCGYVCLSLLGLSCGAVFVLGERTVALQSPAGIKRLRLNAQSKTFLALCVTP